MRMNLAIIKRAFWLVILLLLIPILLTGQIHNQDNDSTSLKSEFERLPELLKSKDITDTD